MNILNTWQFNVAAYLVTIVCFYQSYRIAAKNARNDGAMTVILQVTAGILILFLAPFLPFSFPKSPLTYIFLVVACLFYAVMDRLQTTARKHLQVSQFTIINQLSTAFLIAFGVIFFREQLTVGKLAGAILIVLGNLILFYRKGVFVLTKYTWVGIAATLFFVIAISVDIGISSQFNLPVYIMLTLVIPATIITLAERKPLSIIAEEYRKADKRWIYLTGVSWGLAIFFSLRSFQFGRVTTIIPLQATSTILNVVAAYLFLHERADLKKKILAAFIVFAGICLNVLV